MEKNEVGFTIPGAVGHVHSGHGEQHHSPSVVVVEKDRHRTDGWTGKDTSSEVGRHVVQHINQRGAEGVAATNDRASNLKDALTDRNAEVKAEVGETHRWHNKEITDGFRFAAKDTSDLQYRYSREVAETQKDLAKDLCEGFKDGALAACATQRDVLALAKDLQITERNILIDAQKVAAAAALTAATNQAATMAAIAACCCEQKELTRAMAQATQDLINTNEKDRLKDALQEERLRRLIPAATVAAA